MRSASSRTCNASLLLLSRSRAMSRSAQTDRPETRAFQVSGDQTARVTPVPIPNTVVKPRRADDTAWVTVWERRSSPGLNQRPVRFFGPAFFVFRRGFAAVCEGTNQLVEVGSRQPQNLGHFQLSPSLSAPCSHLSSFCQMPLGIAPSPLVSPPSRAHELATPATHALQTRSALP